MALHMTTPVRTKRIGEALVERGLISPAQLAKALDIQQRTGERLGRILIALGVIKRKTLYTVLAELWGIPFADLTQQKPDPKALSPLRPC